MSTSDGGKYDDGFNLTQMVEAQRGLSDTEIVVFLATGVKPDLSLPPPEERLAMGEDDSIITASAARDLLSGRPLVASAFLDFDSHHGVSSHYEQLVASGAFRFDPNQPRDGDGKWTKNPLGKLADLAKSASKLGQGTKKSTPATIYKKHSNGAVISQSKAGDRRMRWDADQKKFIVEKHRDGKWTRESSLAKSAAYNELKKPDTWYEPTEINDSSASMSRTPEPASTSVQESPAPNAKIASGLQKQAVDSYRLGGYAAVNRQLRTGQKQKLISMDTDELIKGLDEAMNANVTTDDQYLWRGLNVSPGDLSVGTVLEDKAFLSTTKDRATAEHFALSPPDINAVGASQPVLMNIKVPAGSKALDFGGGEQEVLLDRGAKIKITSTFKGKNGITMVNAELTSDDESVDAEMPATPVQAPTPSASSTTKLKPSAIYGKYNDGDTVAQSTDGSQRMRWDAGRKKFIVEREKDGDWVEDSVLTKGAAYNDVKNSDKWYKPNESGQTNAVDEPSSPPQTPELNPVDTEPTVPNSAPDAPEVPSADYVGPSVTIPDALSQDILDQYVDLVARHSQWENNPKMPNLSQEDRMKMYDLNVSIRDLSDNSIVRRMDQIGAITGALATWRAEHSDLADISDAEVKQRLADQVRETFAGKKIGIRVTPQTLAVVLSDGRFKTQFETKSSAGYNDPKFRAMFEAQWFGIGQGLPDDEAVKVTPERRPIYGYVMVDGVRPINTDKGKDMLSWYGNIQVVLKDEVRKRTTAMFGDSINDHKNGMPSPIDNPTWESYTPMARQGVPEEYSHPLTARDRDVNSDKFKSKTYAEAQIHDGVTISDIEEVIFPTEPSADLRANLESAGISWRVLTAEGA